MNKDPKASEEFHKVKTAYDRLRSIYEEDEGLKQSHEDSERRQGLVQLQPLDMRAVATLNGGKVAGRENFGYAGSSSS